MHPWAEVPSEIGELLRPGIHTVADEVIAAVRAEVPEYDRSMEGEFGRFMTEGVTVALDQFVGMLGRDDELQDLETYEWLGRAEHRAGRTLDALQSAYRIGARVSWRAVAETGRAQGVDPSTMYRLAEAIFAYIDRLAAASVAGHAQAEALRAGTLQARRHALVELLAGAAAPDPAEVARLAGEAGLTPPPQRVAALATADADAVLLARRLPSGSFAAGLEPVGVALVPDPDGPGRRAQIGAALRDRRAVLGPTVDWLEARASIERALLGWTLHAAGELGDEPLALTDDHAVGLVLASAPRIATDLVDKHLAPLDALTPGARARALETLRAWLDAHGDVSGAAAALHVHPQTVRYRLGTLRETLGDAPLDDPRLRLELLLALQAATARRGASGASDGDAPAVPPPGKA